MSTNNRLGTVRVTRTVPCPPSCRWHGTDVLHARHEQRAETDVVTLEEACRRLGVSPMFQYPQLADVKVAFNDRVCQNYSVGQSKAIYSFQTVYQEKWGAYTLAATSLAVAERPDGVIEACVVS